VKKLLGWLAGILATVIGGLLLYLLTPGQQADVTATPSGPVIEVTQLAGAAVDFQITDELGDGQVTERVTVVIDGRSVGTLTVDTVHRTASLTVTVPRAGSYDYELASTMVVEDEYGNSYQLSGYGTGLIQVTDGRSYAVVGDFRVHPIPLVLQ
jgi:hypothetical protein